MPEDNVPTSVPLGDELPGRMRIRTMLLAKGFTISSWARHREIVHVEQVNMMLASARPYEEVRDLLAADLGLTREQFDAMIPLPVAAAKDVA